MRRAILVQVTLATVALQQFPGGGNNFVRADFEHSRIGFRAAGVRGRTGRAAQNDAPSPEGPIARWIGGTEDCDYGNPKRRGQVQGAGIASDEEPCAARESDQFGE